MDDQVKAAGSEQSEKPVEEVRKPVELSAEELEKAAGGAPTEPCDKMSR